MVAEFYEIEIAHRREQLLEIRRRVGSSRRQRRRQAALAAAEHSAGQVTVARSLPPVDAEQTSPQVIRLDEVCRSATG